MKVLPQLPFSRLRFIHNEFHLMQPIRCGILINIAQYFYMKLPNKKKKTVKQSWRLRRINWPVSIKEMVNFYDLVGDCQPNWTHPIYFPINFIWTKVLHDSIVVNAWKIRTNTYSWNSNLLKITRRQFELIRSPQPLTEQKKISTLN